MWTHPPSPTITLNSSYRKVTKASAVGSIPDSQDSDSRSSSWAQCCCWIFTTHLNTGCETPFWVWDDKPSALDHTLLTTPTHNWGLLRRKLHYFFPFLRAVFFPPRLEGLQYLASIWARKLSISFCRSFCLLCLKRANTRFQKLRLSKDFWKHLGVAGVGGTRRWDKKAMQCPMTSAESCIALRLENTEMDTLKC